MTSSSRPNHSPNPNPNPTSPTRSRRSRDSLQSHSPSRSLDNHPRSRRRSL